MPGVGNWYRGVVAGEKMVGWLCPALFCYFEQAPKKIFVKAEPLLTGVDPIWRVKADDPRARRFVQHRVSRRVDYSKIEFRNGGPWLHPAYFMTLSVLSFFRRWAEIFGHQLFRLGNLGNRYRLPAAAWMEAIQWADKMVMPTPDCLRKLVVEVLTQLGITDAEKCCEAILVRAGFYAGREFKANDIRAIWLVDQDIVQFYRDKKLVKAVRCNVAVPRETEKAA